MNTRPIILLEDSDDDAFFLQRALQAAGVVNPIVRLADGDSALSYFEQPPSAPRPCLALLDIKLPHRSGLEILQWLRGRPEHRALAVIMLTSSSEPAEIARALELGANAFVTKPAAFSELTHLATAIRDFWLRHHRGLA